jgi:hypothetical protein
MKRDISRITILGLLFSACSAWAGPPFITDDPETPEWHGWEINIPFTLERTADRLEMQIPLFDINYGFKPNVQLKVEFPFLYSHPVDGGQEFGLGDTLIGIKWRFIEEGKKRPQLAIYPQVILPTGDSKRDLGEGNPSYLIPLVGQKSWDKWTLYGNIGYAVQTAEDSRNFWYSGLVITRDISERMKFGGELFGNSKRKDRTEIGFNLGGEFSLSDRIRLLFSAGRSFREGPSLSVYFGLQIVTKGHGERRRGECVNGP